MNKKTSINIIGENSYGKVEADIDKAFTYIPNKLKQDKEILFTDRSGKSKMIPNPWYKEDDGK